MKKLFVAMFAVFIGVFTAHADHERPMWDPQGLPEDEQRGPWFATIDLEATDWAWKRQSDIVRKGPTALRFEMRDGDCFTALPHTPEEGWDDCTRDRERSEISEKWKPELDRNVWYAFSLYIPEDYPYMYPKQMFFQWHNKVWGPNIYFHLNRNEFQIDVLAEEHETTQKYHMGELPKGVWLDFAVNIVWTNSDNGKMVLYIDGDKVVDYRGPTMDDRSYTMGASPQVKMGLYRSHLFRWESEDPHPTQIIYHDEYRRGYTFREVDVRRYEGD